LLTPTRISPPSKLLSTHAAVGSCIRNEQQISNTKARRNLLSAAHTPMERVAKSQTLESGDILPIDHTYSQSSSGQPRVRSACGKGSSLPHVKKQANADTRDEQTQLSDVELKLVDIAAYVRNDVTLQMDRSVK